MNIALYHTRIFLLATGFVVIPSIAFSGSSNTTSVISPTEFFETALENEVSIASFESVATWLQEGTVVLIDLRSNQDFAKFHIDGAINLPATDITDESLAKVIPSKETRVVVYCSNNFILSRRIALTTMAYPAIKQLGYKNTFLLQSPFLDDIAPLTLIKSPQE